MHLLLESWIGGTMHWYVNDELDRWDNAFVIGGWIGRTIRIDY